MGQDEFPGKAVRHARRRGKQIHGPRRLDLPPYPVLRQVDIMHGCGPAKVVGRGACWHDAVLPLGGAIVPAYAAEALEDGLSRADGGSIKKLWGGGRDASRSVKEQESEGSQE